MKNENSKDSNLLNDPLPVAVIKLHHDDPPCYNLLNLDGDCPKCGLHPDMQSTCFHSYCPMCDIELQSELGKLKCPKCDSICFPHLS